MIRKLPNWAAAIVSAVKSAQSVCFCFSPGSHVQRRVGRWRIFQATQVLQLAMCFSFSFSFWFRVLGGTCVGTPISEHAHGRCPWLRDYHGESSGGWEPVVVVVVDVCCWGSAEGGVPQQASRLAGQQASTQETGGRVREGSQQQTEHRRFCRHQQHH